MEESKATRSERVSPTVNQPYIVLLVLVALHDGDDAVVYEEGQSENAGQLGEEQPELCNEVVRISGSCSSKYKDTKWKC